MLKALVVTQDGKTTAELNPEEIPKLRINAEKKVWYFNERNAMGFCIDEIPCYSPGITDYFLLSSGLYLLGVYDMEKEEGRAKSRHAYGVFLSLHFAAQLENFGAGVRAALIEEV